jgi:acetyltransferase-like isoleucine patch superfamily enzyme/acyl carrier protein
MYVSRSCRIWNVYGPAETTLASHYHLVNPMIDINSIPLGRPLLNYRCLIVDSFLQPVCVAQEGELLMGGVGVFAGYLGREDLTAKALIRIDEQTFYRTGDLVRLDKSGLLHYVGRKDYQVKLRGQRIELGEVEECLLNFSSTISGCVVIKWGDDHLVAYVQTDDIDVEQLREHCRCYLPSFMVPWMFIALEQLPLNANGKLNRKHLPPPNPSIFSGSDITDLTPPTPLERRLQNIFAEALHIEVPNINVSFAQLGGTSLDAMHILMLIRQEITAKVDIGVLLSNPSVRQLAGVIEPLLVEKEKSVSVPSSEAENIPSRATPSVIIEAIGILLLACQWLYPIWKVYHCHCPFLVFLIPVFHLLSYVVFRYLLFRSGETLEQIYTLYSWRYYRWWFLDLLWSINNFYWLQHLLGTPFYNYYLRLCGARIDRHAHIYTTSIDAPWLLEVGECTFIGSETTLSNLSLYDQTYQLHRISVGSYCSIGVRSVLHSEVKIHDNVHVSPMSVVTGEISTSLDHPFEVERSFSWNQMIYQLVCLVCLLSIHGILLSLTYMMYQRCLLFSQLLPFCLAFSWLFWTVLSLFSVMILLKFVVGDTTPGVYSVNSYYYLHKLWLRQLIISSFYHSFDIWPIFNLLSPILLRWLGAHIDNDVKLGVLQQILHFPSNLLQFDSGVTTFGAVMLAPFEMTKSGRCHVDRVHLGSRTNLGNRCTLMPGTQLEHGSMVGTLTLVTRETRSSGPGAILLGAPGRQMPFAMPNNTDHMKDSLLFDSPSLLGLVFTCFFFFIGKSLFISLYWLLPVPMAVVFQTVFYCTIHHYSTSNQRASGSFAYSEVINCIQQLLDSVMIDFNIFITPFLSRTQFLVFLHRTLGARIGRDVILSDVNCLSDPQLVTIGDHVRFNTGASIQVTRRFVVCSLIL